MKISKYFFLLALITLFTACASESVDKNEITSDIVISDSELVGSWTLDDMVMEGIPEKQKAMMATMIEGIKGNLTFTFSDDGQIDIEGSMMGMSKNEKGTYTQDGGTITINSDKSENQELQYEINDNRLFLTGEENGRKMKMIYIKK